MLVIYAKVNHWFCIKSIREVVQHRTLGKDSDTQQGQVPRQIPIKKDTVTLWLSSLQPYFHSNLICHRLSLPNMLIACHRLSRNSLVIFIFLFMQLFISSPVVSARKIFCTNLWRMRHVYIHGRVVYCLSSPNVCVYLPQSLNSPNKKIEERNLADIIYTLRHPSLNSL